jgi:hypothetical protein
MLNGNVENNGQKYYVLASNLVISTLERRRDNIFSIN